jgi:mRNA interferase YafQ
LQKRPGRHTAPDKRGFRPPSTASDTPLPHRYFDHPLSGEWSGFRDCHIRPDLVLIYEKPDAHKLRLVRLGSHSELGS